MRELPNGLIAFGPEANCTLDTCPLEASLLRYQPNTPSTIVFIVVFALSMIAHTWQGVRTKSWGFMASMISGCILEIIGYIGRLIIHDNPFNFSGFLMQIICITVAPVFFCSAIYVLLSQVANYVDASVSRFKPQLFYWVFIPCDIVSLVLQALGGALSCTGATEHDINVGEDISLAGLIFQVVTLVTFCVAFADYVLRARRSSSRDRLDRPLMTFLGFMFAATFFVLIRCVYRIVELGQGYFSELFRDEGLFIAFESVMMCIAVLLLNAGHPGPVFNRRRALSKEDQSPEQSVYQMTEASPAASFKN
ncbi:Parasitic phase-specific protein PSP-1 [Scedosporium apiospermum]|uniref:Parasitic phase-specific protein PSP-1 n=1 Tax=Pseudallescheria apiosperma TaxID=563466 RepID=A0A084G7Z4_PSEDA|nr:Parasitic phase-specific protein PSP-1 [Scedosporium apiospermum]KEZ43456.1 Parasitic phase-specific protein PSP-1 [Scedosporium apiospermum]